MKNFLIKLWTKIFGETPDKSSIKVTIIEDVKKFIPVKIEQVCKCGKAGCKCDGNCSCSTSKEIKKPEVKKAPLIKQTIKQKPVIKKKKK